VTAGVASPRTARAIEFVADRRSVAEQLGRDLGDLVPDPDEFAATLRTGLAALADPEYLEGQRRIAPGLGPTIGVRWPLLAAVGRGLRGATRRDAPTALLFVADRLFQEEPLEPRWLAFGILERIVMREPERAWQLLRRGAREAHDWITVDTLAHAYGRGILSEPYRWAELEQLVYSPSRWERRLVGSTIATIPFIDRRLGRAPSVAARGLALVEQLIGDAEPDVQRALSWALRSLVLVDPDAVTALAEREAGVAVAEDDGHRAWVVRDTLPKLDPARARDLRRRLSAVRKRPGAGPTSNAAATATRFADLALGTAISEPPLQ
jgi:3-methyladenine DNA glycosylase AlkD